MSNTQHFFVHANGELKGPFGLDQLRTELDAGRIASDDKVSFKGSDEWITASDLLSSTDLPPEIVESPKPESPSPQNIHSVLAILATVFFLAHGILDFWEWKVIMDNDGVPVEESAVPSLDDEPMLETEDATMATSPDIEEIEEGAMAPKWAGAVKAVLFPLGLILALTAGWQFERNWWRGLIVLCCLVEAALGLFIFLGFYNVGLSGEGLLYSTGYILWNANRLLLLFIWGIPRKSVWMMPVGLIVLTLIPAMLVDILTYFFVEPGYFGFRFLDGTFWQSLANKLAGAGDLGMYSWLAVKLLIMAGVLLIVLPHILKQRVHR